MRLAYLHYLSADDTALTHVREFSHAAESLGTSLEVHAMNGSVGAPDGEDSAPGARARLRAALKARLGRYLHEPKELLWNLKYVAREYDLLRGRGLDALLVRDHMWTASSLMVGRLLAVPVILEVNSPAAESRLYYDGYAHLPRIPEWLEGWKLRAADRVIVVSEALRDYFVETYRVSGEKFVVNPNGADVDRFRPDVVPLPEIAALREKGPTIGLVGSFQEFHGIEMLIELVRRVQVACPTAQFVMVGQGPGLEALARAGSDLQRNVHYAGRLPHEDIPRVATAFDVTVLPETAFYCSPLKVLEWMAAERTIVAPAYGPVRELLVDGEHGLLFPPRDLPQMVQQISLAVADPILRERLGTAAGHRVRAEFTWKHNAARVLDACRREIGESDAVAVSPLPDGLVGDEGCL